MTASEARQMEWELHEFPKIVEKIKEAIQDGKKFINIGKPSSEVMDFLKKLGYKLESETNDDYEMRVEYYKLYW